MDGRNVTHLMMTTPMGTTHDFTSRKSISLKSLPLIELLNWMWTVSLPIAFTLGVFGNVLSIVILRRLQSDPSALDRYFLCLAVTDLCFNFTGSLRRWIVVVTGFRPFAIHDFVCKIGTFVLNAAAACSAWLVVVMVAHRAVSVVWPHRVKVMCTSRTSWATIVSVFIFFSLAYSHLLYGLEVHSGVCTPKKDYVAFLSNVFTKLDIFLYSVLPFIGLMVSNIVLVVKLRSSAKEAGDQFVATDTQKNTREKKVNSITLTALVVSVSFIIFTLPHAIKNIVDIGAAKESETKDIQELAFDNFLQNFFLCFGSFNFSINFYLYCLTGQRFRKEFLKIVRGLLSCIKTNDTVNP